MALSQEDKYRIIFSLCHTGKILIPSSTHYNSIVNDRLNNLDTFIEERALSLVAKIEQSKLNLESTQKDNVKQIGDIHLDTTMSRSLKQKELSRLLSELSQLLDIPNRCKVGGVGVGCLVL
jgi:hypothetical protein